MTYTPTIYDWPETCAPINQMFRAGGQSIAGGMTLGGAAVENPEPGGRATCEMDFAAFVTDEANRDASWLASRILNGNVMRLPLWDTVQLVPRDQIFGSAADRVIETVDPFSNIPKTYWNPSVPITQAGAKGTATITASADGVDGASSLTMNLTGPRSLPSIFASSAPVRAAFQSPPARRNWA